jgi:fructose-1,6-bisphosphatase I
MYSINEAYRAKWDPRLAGYIDSLKAPELGFTQRYIGSLVADFHRNLLKGGLFIYPSTNAAPNGKLRVLYEAFPLAFIVELAGGSATNGRDRILSMKAQDLHQRTPLVIGNSELVAQATAALVAD